MPADGWLARQAAKIEAQAPLRPAWLRRHGMGDVASTSSDAVMAEHTAPPLKLGAAKRVAEQAISEIVREPGERNMLLVIAALQGLIDAAQEAERDRALKAIEEAANDRT